MQTNSVKLAIYVKKPTSLTSIRRIVLAKPQSERGTEKCNDRQTTIIERDFSNVITYIIERTNLNDELYGTCNRNYENYQMCNHNNIHYGLRYTV